METIKNLKIRLALWFQQISGRHLILSLGFPLIFTLGTYFVLIPIISVFSSAPLHYAADVLAHRGPIPYIITFFFWMMLGLLFLRELMLELELYALHKIKSDLTLRNSMVYTDSRDIIKDVEETKFEDIQQSLIVRRIIHGMWRLFRTQDTNALSDYFKLRSELEYAEMETGLSVVKYINWLIPTLGFIGTVLGIGFGIAGFASIIEEAQNFDQIRKFLPQVTSSLGVAFDTTFLALIFSVIGMFLTSFISRKYSQLLEEIDAYCLDDISSKFQLHSTTAEQLKDVLREIKDDIGNLLGSNRIEVGNLIRENIDNLKDEVTSLNHQLQEFPKEKNNINHILKSLGEIHKSINSSKSEIDLNPVIQELRDLKSSFEAKDLGGNFSPLIDALHDIKTSLEKNKQSVEPKVEKSKTK